MRGSSYSMNVPFVLMFGKLIEHFQLCNNLNRSYFCGYEQFRYDFSVLNTVSKSTKAIVAILKISNVVCDHYLKSHQLLPASSN